MRTTASQRFEYWESYKPESLTASSADFPNVITNSIGMQLILVQPSTFQMGSDDGPSSEKPVHMVTISKPFYIGKYEVTQIQWQQIMGDNARRFRFKGNNRPVENVSWDDAQAFIRKLNQRENTEKYRLPTEAEWEFAARGGMHSRGFTFAGSFNVGEVAVYNENFGGETSVVGSKAPNELGIFDMSGNVSEWCQDWYYGAYESGLSTDPAGPWTGITRVLRGGTCRFEEYGCRVTSRTGWASYYKNDDVGFRCAKDVN